MVVQKNAEYDIEIDGMTHEGLGVGRIDNFTVFVEGAIKGEKVHIKIIKVTKSYAVGKLLKILEASPQRIEPFCPVYKRCGGCSLQHLSYEAQLEFKTNTVKDNITRIGKLENVIVHDAIGMEKPMRYRNKTQLPVAGTPTKPLIGFFAKRSHEVIDIGSTSCGIQDEVSSEITELIRNFISKHGISIYDEKNQVGILRHIMTRVGFKTGEVMVVLVINARDLPARKALVKELTSAVPQVKSIYLNINTKNTNVILGEKNIKIFGSDTITDYIGKYKFHISPLSFYQVNPVQTEVLYNKALEYAGLTGSETVFDLYCGIGTISLFLSEKAGKVYGVEVIEDAVRDAKRNAEINGVNNVEFIAGEAETVIPEMYANGIKADVVVVDPPRKGCDERLLKTLVEMQPKRIVYVSCNPSTLARDLHYLDQNGYRAVEVQPVDMFPWTHHVESIVLMSRVDK